MPEAPGQGPGTFLLGGAAAEEEPPARRAGPDLLLLALLLGLAVVLAGPMLVATDPLDQVLSARNAPPSAEAWLGRDNLGRDVFARLVAGARITLLVASASALLALAIGAGLGLAALAAGPWASGPVFAVFDLVRAMPSVLLALSLLVALGSGFWPVVLALGLAFAPTMALVARGAWLRERSAGYVEAAVAAGGTPLGILRRHVAPNVAGVLVTQVAIILPRCITSESVLSFLGLGVPPEVPSWGRMIAASLPFVERAPHALAAPALALAALTLLLALAGDRLRKRLDPVRAGA
jgi:ABC-type dipeptide/oligopeptide/nickel transport system permease subunit